MHRTTKITATFWTGIRYQNRLAELISVRVDAGILRQTLAWLSRRLTLISERLSDFASVALLSDRANRCGMRSAGVLIPEPSMSRCGHSMRCRHLKHATVRV